MNARLLSLAALLPLVSFSSALVQSGASPRSSIHVPTVGLASFEFNPALEVSVDGSIWLRGEELLAANPSDAEMKLFFTWLSEFATKRDLRTHDLAADTGGESLGELLQIRADVNAPFDSVLTILEACERREIQVTHVGFHVNQELSADGGLQEYGIPRAILADSLGQDWEYELHTVDVALSVQVAGSKRNPDDMSKSWDGTVGSRFAYNPKERVLDYAFDGLTSQSVHWADVQCLRIAREVEREDRDVVFRINVGSGVTFGEVFEFWQRSADSIIPYFRRSEE